MQPAREPEGAASGPAVLDEDQYAMGLQSVITRRYFPQLPVLRAEHSRLVAERLDDTAALHALRARLEEEQADLAAPVPPELATVDAFVASYAGEDNASFASLQEAELRRRRERDVWGAKQRELREREGHKRLKGLDREDALLEWRPDPNQQLMGIPDARDVRDTQLALAAATAAERIVDPDNTRFSAEQLAALSTVPAPKRAPEDADKVRKLSALVRMNRFLDPAAPRGPAAIDLDDFYDVAAANVLAEPTVRGYTLLATPVAVDHGRRFHMAETPERDKVAQRLADESARRRSAIVPGRTPALQSPALFSPAGQKLLEARLKATTPGSARGVMLKSPAIFASPAVRSRDEGTSRKRPDAFATPTQGALKRK